MIDWATPIQERHLDEALRGSLKLAREEDPNEPAFTVRVVVTEQPLGEPDAPTAPVAPRT